MCWSLDPQLGPPFSHAIGFTYTTTMLHPKLRDSLRWTITREAWVIDTYIYICFVSELIISWTNKAISLFFKSTMIYLFLPQLHLYVGPFYFPQGTFFLVLAKRLFSLKQRPASLVPKVCGVCSIGAEKKLLLWGHGFLLAVSQPDWWVYTRCLT